jgi:4-amino-4-deoxy-L-arabinose transferase-like glycosyltransferase
MLNLKPYKSRLYIIILGIILFIPFLGGAHLFDWDEINFAESAREMLVSGNYLTVQINYMPFWEKPPLFIWMQVLSMKIFGINEFAARFPNAICGILTLLVLFNTGKKFRNEKFGWIWVMTYAGSLLPFIYFKSGIIDPWFNLFIFLGIIHFVYYLSMKNSRTLNIVCSAFFLGLAILTKGPVAIIIFTLTFLIYLVFVRFRIKTSFRDVILFILVLSITGGFWFLLQILSGNFGIIRDFIIYQVRLFQTEDAGHGGFLFYHFVILVLGVFPASIFALFSFFKKAADKDGKSGFSLWMQILFFVVLILFTIVKTKIVHYSSMCYFPLSFIASVSIWKIISGEMRAGRLLRILLTIISVIIGLFIAIIPFIDVMKGTIISKGWIKDIFAVRNLDASGNWTGFESLIGILFIFASLWFIRHLSKNTSLSITGIFVSVTVLLFLSMAIITPRIETYSQRAAIEFYASVKNEDAYITTLGFKSYAHLFYGEVSPPKNISAKEKGWFLNGNIDKKTYVVFKISRKERTLREYPDLKILYEKNGFVFAKRETSQDKR